jgi:hypothetical protein
MYKEHSAFIQPNNEDILVWRYMDFTKFVSLLDSRRLYFTRADKFDDPFEGSWPKMNVLARMIVPDGIPDEHKDYFLKQMANLGAINKKWPRFNAINCWHMNEHESAAMWRLYLKSDEGIAIQSTYSNLKKSFIDDESIFVGKVKYIDYELEHINSGNILEPFVHKRKSFEHEREVRCVVTKLPRREGALDLSIDTIDYGVNIRVDIETLVLRVFVAPSAPEWFSELVSAVISRYGYKFPVSHSRLNEEPVF